MRPSPFVGAVRNGEEIETVDLVHILNPQEASEVRPFGAPWLYRSSASIIAERTHMTRAVRKMSSDIFQMVCLIDNKLFVWRQNFRLLLNHA